MRNGALIKRRVIQNIALFCEQFNKYSSVSNRENP
jgi:hypothetical protein